MHPEETRSTETHSVSNLDNAVNGKCSQNVDFSDLLIELGAQGRTLFTQFVHFRSQRFQFLDETGRHRGGIGDSRGSNDRLLTNDVLNRREISLHEDSPPLIEIFEVRGVLNKVVEYGNEISP